MGIPLQEANTDTAIEATNGEARFRGSVSIILSVSDYDYDGFCDLTESALHEPSAPQLAILIGSIRRPLQ
jgi:hypothetical protein